MFDNGHRVLAALMMVTFCLLTIVAPAVSQTADNQAQLPWFRNWTGDFDGMEERRLVRILVPFSRTIYFLDGGEQQGTAVEFGNALEKKLNAGRKKEIDKIRIAYVPTSRDRLIPALIEGKGDIIAANLTITPGRLAEVDFTDPFAKNVKEILVTGPKSPAIETVDGLAGQSIQARASSSYYEHLLNLNQRLKNEGKPEIDVVKADDNLEDEDLLEMVNAGLMPWCIVDDHKARIWAKVFDNIELHEDIAIAENGEIAWAIRKDSPKLKSLLNDFVKNNRAGTTFGNIIKKRYYTDDKIVRSAFDDGELEKYRELRKTFAKHASTYKFDELFLAAQGYQESTLDQTKRSNRGAVGIMQMLPSTAADKVVAITGIADDADKNIEAGAKYLRYIVDENLTEDGVDPINRQLLALAGYNAGPGNLRKIRRTTSDMGLDPDVWFGNVENGAAKVIGRETVQYVSNIYKYYIAYKSADAMIDKKD